jgi:hypothetical protein
VKRLFETAAHRTDAVGRTQRLLRRAHRQFMPARDNVVAIVASRAHLPEIETALLGTAVERWDRLPRRGERVAHGRGADGFWSGRRYDASRVVAWIELDEGLRVSDAAVWRRSAESARLADEVQSLLR